jgi:hypothetical protein
MTCKKYVTLVLTLAILTVFNNQESNADPEISSPVENASADVLVAPDAVVEAINDALAVGDQEKAKEILNDLAEGTVVKADETIGSDRIETADSESTQTPDSESTETANSESTEANNSESTEAIVSQEQPQTWGEFIKGKLPSKNAVKVTGIVVGAAIGIPLATKYGFLISQSAFQAYRDGTLTSTLNGVLIQAGNAADVVATYTGLKVFYYAGSAVKNAATTHASTAWNTTASYAGAAIDTSASYAQTAKETFIAGASNVGSGLNSVTGFVYSAPYNAGNYLGSLLHTAAAKAGVEPQFSAASQFIGHYADVALNGTLTAIKGTVSYVLGLNKAVVNSTALSTLVLKTAGN